MNFWWPEINRIGISGYHVCISGGQKWISDGQKLPSRAFSRHQQCIYGGQPEISGGGASHWQLLATFSFWARQRPSKWELLLDKGRPLAANYPYVHFGAPEMHRWRPEMDFWWPEITRMLIYGHQKYKDSFLATRNTLLVAINGFLMVRKYSYGHLHLAFWRPEMDFWWPEITRACISGHQKCIAGGQKLISGGQKLLIG